MVDSDERYREFVLNFFEKLGCKVNMVVDKDNGFTYYLVSDVPRSFSDFVGREGPYKICFEQPVLGCEKVFAHSVIGLAIARFLDSAGKTTLLKIEFDVDAENEISRILRLKNCQVESVIKRDRRKFFTRYSFLTTFSYLNEKEQILNEVYVHDSKVVKGDLSGYKVIEGREKKIGGDFLREGFLIAKEHLKGLIEEKKNELSEVVGLKLSEEVQRIEEYYGRQLDEFSREINERLLKINELEFEARFSDEGREKSDLVLRIEKLKKSLLKVTEDDAKEKVIREKEFSIRDSKEKFSLQISNKVLNTTVIYYPSFIFSVYLKNGGAKRLVELVYDPLTRDFDNFNCEVCSSSLSDVLLCLNGHLVCGECMGQCEECSKNYCLNCLRKSCNVCGKNICSNCLEICRGCSKLVCNSHYRKDNVSGEERCVNCLRACSRCHGLSQEKFFGVSENQSKVCQRCLGEEKTKKALGKVFG